MKRLKSLLFLMMLALTGQATSAESFTTTISRTQGGWASLQFTTSWCAEDECTGASLGCDEHGFFVLVEGFGSKEISDWLAEAGGWGSMTVDKTVFSLKNYRMDYIDGAGNWVLCFRNTSSGPNIWSTLTASKTIVLTVGNRSLSLPHSGVVEQIARICSAKVSARR